MKSLFFLVLLILNIQIYGQEYHQYVDIDRKFSIMLPFGYNITEDTFKQGLSHLNIDLNINGTEVGITIFEMNYNAITFDDKMEEIIETVKKQKYKDEYLDFENTLILFLIITMSGKNILSIIFPSKMRLSGTYRFNNMKLLRYISL